MKHQSVLTISLTTLVMPIASIYIHLRLLERHRVHLRCLKSSL